MRASIATDLAPNFRLTQRRCILTVTSLIESSFAIYLVDLGMAIVEPSDGNFPWLDTLPPEHIVAKRVRRPRQV
jgi:hypothetical protein